MAHEEAETIIIILIYWYCPLQIPPPHPQKNERGFWRRKNFHHHLPPFANQFIAAVPWSIPTFQEAKNLPILGMGSWAIKKQIIIVICFCYNFHKSPPFPPKKKRGFWRSKHLYHQLHPFAHPELQFHPHFLGSKKLGFSGHGFMGHEEAENIIIILICCYCLFTNSEAKDGSWRRRNFHQQFPIIMCISLAHPFTTGVPSLLFRNQKLALSLSLTHTRCFGDLVLGLFLWVLFLVMGFGEGFYGFLFLWWVLVRDLWVCNFVMGWWGIVDGKGKWCVCYCVVWLVVGFLFLVKFCVGCSFFDELW